MNCSTPMRYLAGLWGFKLYWATRKPRLFLYPGLYLWVPRFWPRWMGRRRWLYGTNLRILPLRRQTL